MTSDRTRQLKHWEELAMAAAKESNPRKLAKIIEELCAALTQRDQRRKESRTQDANLGTS